MEVRQRLVREDQKKKTNQKKRRLGQLTSPEPGDHADLAPPEELSQARRERGEGGWNTEVAPLEGTTVLDVTQ